MSWIPLLWIIIALGIVFFMYTKSQSSAPVPVARQIDVPPGGLEAIEYYWRPG